MLVYELSYIVSPSKKHKAYCAARSKYNDPAVELGRDSKRRKGDVNMCRQQIKLVMMPSKLILEIQLQEVTFK